MAYEFTKLSDLPVEQEFPEGGKVIINDNGIIKQCEANGLGGGAGGMAIDFQGVGYFVTAEDFMGGGGAAPVSIDPDAPDYMEGFYVVPDSYMEQLKNTYFNGGNVVVISHQLWTDDDWPEEENSLSDGIMPLGTDEPPYEYIEVFPCKGYMSNIFMDGIVLDQPHCGFDIGRNVEVIPFEGATYSIIVSIYAIIDETTFEEVRRYVESYEPPRDA